MTQACEIYEAITGLAMDEHNAYVLMLAVKLARLQADPHFTPDHYVDICGYTALLAEADSIRRPNKGATNEEDAD